MQFSWLLAHNSDFLICQMLLHVTYGFLLLFAFVQTISYHNWFAYAVTILPAAFYNLCLLFEFTYHALWYVICNYTLDIWEVRIMSQLSSHAIIKYSWKIQTCSAKNHFRRKFASSAFDQNLAEQAKIVAVGWLC